MDERPDLRTWSLEVRARAARVIYTAANQWRRENAGQPSHVFKLLERIAEWLKPPEKE